MKTLIITLLLLCIYIGSQAQANVTLSNLSPATRVNASLKPKTTGTLDLGKPDSAWKNLYLNGSVFLNGKETVKSISDANDNILFGNAAGVNITTGIENIAIGNLALNQNQTGTGNIAIGKAALFINSNGYGNTATGDQSMVNNTTGNYNSAFGYQTLYSNTAGEQNNAFGYQSLYHNNGAGFNGYQNNAFGNNTLFNNTTGSFNSAFGNHVLFLNTIGVANTGVGNNVLFNNNSGSYNTAVGNLALTSNTTGSWNTAIGTRALFPNTAQDKNTAIGWSAGDGAQSAASTYVGYNAHASTIVSGSTAVGINATVTASNQVRIGTSAITSIGGYVNWSNISDGRVKKNIKQNVPGLAFINKLNPVTYNLDLNAADKIIGTLAVKDENGKTIPPDTQESIARQAKEQVVYTGFIAQEVEKTANALGYNFSGIDAAKNNKDLYGLRYADFVVPLVKAVQELSAQNDKLINEITAIKEQLNLVLQQTNIAAPTSGINQPASASVSLQQNIPNPFSTVTTIRYSIPSQAKGASLNISSSAGQVLKTIALTKEKGEVSINAGELSVGTYYYTLIADGKQYGTKQMIVIK